MGVDLLHDCLAVVGDNGHGLGLAVTLDDPEYDHLARAPQLRGPWRAPPKVVSSHSTAPVNGSRHCSAWAQRAHIHRHIFTAALAPQTGRKCCR